MEFFFNFVWALLSAAILCIWLRIDNRRSDERRLPLVAVGLLIVLLFPVISVSDDLQAAQNPAEVESSLRQDHKATAAHSILFAVAALPPCVYPGMPFRFLGVTAPTMISAPLVDNPAMAAIQNRPPPGACA